MRYLSSAVLAILVAGSLVLAARLWTPDQTVRPPLVGAARYQIRGTVAELSAADLAQPWQMVVHFGAAHSAVLADPGDARYSATWSDVEAVLRDLAPPATAATPAGAQACASLAEDAPYSIELALGEALPWSTWAVLWGLPGASSGSAGPSPSLDRLLIAPAVAAAAPGAPTAAGATVCRYAGLDAAEYRVPPSAAMRTLAADLAALTTQPLDYDVVPLGPVPGLVLRPGIEVPEPGFSRGSVRVQPERIVPSDMLAALFPPAASVRRTPGVNGLGNYSDDLAELHLGGDGSLQYAVGVVPTPDSEGPGPALLAAAAFVDQAGGWPPTGLLFDLASLPQPGSFRLHGGEVASSGYRITFTERWHGMPLLADPAPIAVQVGAPGILAYARAVSVPAQQRPAQPLLPAAQALADLAASWPPAAAGAERAVVDVFPAYLPGGGGKLWQPAWGVELADGSIIALSARSGATVDVLRPQGG